MLSPATHDAQDVLAGLGVAGQVIVALFILAALFAILRLTAPLDVLRRLFWGYELWAGFVVAAIATGGSLFLSQIANYPPCEMCWFQRICMYPLSILLLLMAYRSDYRAARYLFPLPLVGACASIYHIAIENRWVTEPQACTASGPPCDTKWINYFGYMTIPTLALTGFLLLIGFLVLASSGQSEEAATLPADAER